MAACTAHLALPVHSLHRKTRWQHRIVVSCQRTSVLPALPKRLMCWHHKAQLLPHQGGIMSYWALPLQTQLTKSFAITDAADKTATTDAAGKSICHDDGAMLLVVKIPNGETLDQKLQPCVHWWHQSQHDPACHASIMSGKVLSSARRLAHWPQLEWACCSNAMP